MKQDDTRSNQERPEHTEQSDEHIQTDTDDVMTTTQREFWVEAQIDDNSIALTLVSEDERGSNVEDIQYYTFDELQDMRGEMFRLTMSDETKKESNSGEYSVDIQALKEQVLNTDDGRSGTDNPDTTDTTDIREGDIMIDERSAPWSDDNTVKVVGVSDYPADEYVVDSDNGKQRFNEVTVYDVNPSCEPDEPVIEATYLDGNDKVYAFPISRLSPVE